MDDSARLWAFLYFYHMDKANSAIHCAPVKFSPITFRMYHNLNETWPKDEDITQEMAHVRVHVGTYPEDQGR